MDPVSFRESAAAHDAPPDGLGLALQALWWDARGDWNRAHARAQEDGGATGAAVHAYLHRKEPDLTNARYWYARAGRSPATGTLDEEWTALAEELLTGTP